LTIQGEQLLPRALAVVEAVDAFTAAAAGASDPLQASTRLGLIPTVAPYALPTLLAGLAQQLPSLTLRVVEDQTERLLTLLRERALDAALIALPADAVGVAAIPIYHEDFVLALPPGHPLAGKRRVPTTALAELPLLLLDEGHCLRDQALDVCHKAGVRAELANTRAASLATAVQCVTGGLGRTLIPQSAVPVEAPRSRLGLAQFATPRPGRRIGLVFRSSSGRDVLPAAGRDDRQIDQSAIPGTPHQIAVRPTALLAASPAVSSAYGEGNRCAEAR
jgi:LysR family transcriptional regulator, hydrogen peroxide-inducible genes activator